MSEDEITTLNSLEQVDEHPLYTMRYRGAYPPPTISAVDFHPLASVNLLLSGAQKDPYAGWAMQNAIVSPKTFAMPQEASWGCTLFAALGDPASRLFGRNFDWGFSPALLLFTDPPDGYASVSMVDMEYLGFTGDRAKNLLALPFEERRALLDATTIPFDGMNEQGLAIGMAAVPSGDLQPDPKKKTIGELGVIREILDHAATVDEAIDILGRYNIDMSDVPVHYLVASVTGQSALVEFYRGKMAVFKNENPWQLATNFLLAADSANPLGQCPRYDRINQQLVRTGGILTSQAALDRLAEVAQGGPGSQSATQWSAVYDLTTGAVQIVMGRRYTDGKHTFHLRLVNRD